MALPTNKISKVKLPNNNEYDIIPSMLRDGSTNYKLSVPTLSADSTIALTSDLSSYVPYSGATSDVLLSGHNMGALGLYLVVPGKSVIGEMTNENLDDANNYTVQVKSLWGDLSLVAGPNKIVKYSGYEIANKNWVQAQRYVQGSPSGPRDFADGTLITTSIDYSVTNGDAFYLEIKADGYGAGAYLTQVQGYIYNDTIINYSVNNLGNASINELYAININGHLCFWFPRLAYWQSFSAICNNSMASDYNTNYVTSITNSTHPSGTKEVLLTGSGHLFNNINTGNIGSQSVNYANSSGALTTNAGSSTNPVYFSGGVPVACSYSLNKTVPSDAVFTDHTYNFAGAYFESGNSSNGSHDCNAITYNSHDYYYDNGPSTSIGASTNDGALYTQAYSSYWVAQIAQDYRNGNLFVRGKNSGSWTTWNRVALNGESQPASDVYPWAKQSSKPSYNYSEINAGNIIQGDASGYYSYRQGSGVRAGFYYHSAGDESTVFCNEYSGAGWMFVNGYIPEDHANWQSITPTLQIKRGGVAIGKLIGQGASPSYNLDVNGSANATTVTVNTHATMQYNSTEDCLDFVFA